MLIVTERHETIGTLLAGCYRRVTSVLLVAAWLACVVHYSAQATVYQGFIVGQINVDTADRALSVGRVEAGLAVALQLTPFYRLIPSVERDSILAASPTAPRTVLGAVSATHAFGALFITTRRIANLVRTEVVVMSRESGSASDVLKETGRGVGYGLVRFKTEVEQQAVADPAVLASLQRALCLALHDSTLYQRAEDDFRVWPTPLVGTGGIRFQDEPTLPPWALFADKIVVSYDGIESMLIAATDSDSLTVMDAETRDSIYARAKLFMVENYNEISALEIRVLQAFDVRMVIMGRFTRNASGATFTAALCELVGTGSFRVIREASAECEKDSKEAFRASAALAVRRLLHVES